MFHASLAGAISITTLVVMLLPFPNYTFTGLTFMAFCGRFTP